jgi:hypothetical protein
VDEGEAEAEAEASGEALVAARGGDDSTGPSGGGGTTTGAVHAAPRRGNARTAATDTTSNDVEERPRDIRAPAFHTFTKATREIDRSIGSPATSLARASEP